MGTYIVPRQKTVKSLQYDNEDYILEDYPITFQIAATSATNQTRMLFSLIRDEMFSHNLKDHHNNNTLLAFLGSSENFRIWINFHDSMITTTQAKASPLVERSKLSKIRISIDETPLITKSDPDKSLWLKDSTLLALYILKNTDQPFTPNDQGWCAFQQAIINGDYYVIQAMLKHPQCPPIKQLDDTIIQFSEHSMGVLHAAVKYKRMDIAELLVKNGCNVNQLDSYGRNPLFYASNAHFVQLLTEAHSHTDLKDINGNNIFQYYDQHLSSNEILSVNRALLPFLSNTAQHSMDDIHAQQISFLIKRGAKAPLEQYINTNKLNIQNVFLDNSSNKPFSVIEYSSQLIFDAQASSAAAHAYILDEYLKFEAPKKNIMTAMIAYAATITDKQIATRTKFTEIVREYIVDNYGEGHNSIYHFLHELYCLDLTHFSQKNSRITDGLYNITYYLNNAIRHENKDILEDFCLLQQCSNNQSELLAGEFSKNIIRHGNTRTNFNQMEELFFTKTQSKENREIDLVRNIKDDGAYYLMAVLVNIAPFNFPYQTLSNHIEEMNENGIAVSDECYNTIHNFLSRTKKWSLNNNQSSFVFCHAFESAYLKDKALRVINCTGGNENNSNEQILSRRKRM